MAVCKFVIIGLPRSGTTYLQTLLNSDPRVLCRGEAFDAWQIDDNGRKIRDLDALISRDADPAAFFDERLALGDGPAGPLSAVGLKILFQHNPRLLSDVLPARPGIRILHVHRRNKLARFASMHHAKATGIWTRTEEAAPPPPLEANVRWIAEVCNELGTKDFLLSAWLDGLPNPVLSLEYGALLAPETGPRLLGFLGLAPAATLRSPLRKQGARVILDRFADRSAVAAYFGGIGHADWLGAEI